MTISPALILLWSFSLPHDSASVRFVSGLASASLIRLLSRQHLESVMDVALVEEKFMNRKRLLPRLAFSTNSALRATNARRNWIPLLSTPLRLQTARSTAENVSPKTLGREISLFYGRTPPPSYLWTAKAVPDVGGLCSSRRR